MNPYQFVVLRYVHDVATAEFINIGVVLWDGARQTVMTRFNSRYGRASQFFSDFDGLVYRNALRHVAARFRASAGDLQQLDLLTSDQNLLEVIQSIVPADDGSLQWSPVMSGVTADPERRIRELYHEFVLRHEQDAARERRDEQQIRATVDEQLRKARLHALVKRHIPIRSEDYEYTFHVGWQNGIVNVLEPISFDLVRPTDIVEKANTWSGRLYNLSRGSMFAFTGLIAPPTESGTSRALGKAVTILRHAPMVSNVVMESELPGLISELGHVLRAH